MNRYEKYKDSGIAWIGEIPEHWEVGRLKYFCKITDGTHDTPKYINKSNYSYPLITSKCILNGFIDYNLANHITEQDYMEINKRSNVELNDVIMPMIGTVGNPAIIESNIKFSIKNVALFKMQKDIFKAKYLKYLLNSNIVLEQFSKGNRGGVQQFVSQEFLKNITIILNNKYPLIAEYLDWKCGEIDKVVTTREKQIKLLGELRTSIISRAVTKGLNPNVPVKDSGIAWIGEIPEHWECCAYKHCMKIKNGQDYKHIVSDSGYPVIGSGGQFAVANQFMYDGEVVFLGRKGTIDKPIYYQGKFWAVDTMFYSVPNNNTICKYMYYQALGIPFKRYSTSTALPSITQFDLSNNKIAIPPFKEQQAIANYLDKKTTEIDNAISQYKEQIAKLKEYRQALITEVVTGKIDVREFVIPKK